MHPNMQVGRHAHTHMPTHTRTHTHKLSNQASKEARLYQTASPCYCGWGLVTHCGHQKAHRPPQRAQSPCGGPSCTWPPPAGGGSGCGCGPPAGPPGPGTDSCWNHNSQQSSLQLNHATVNSLHSGWTTQQTTAFTPVETTQQSAVFTPAETTQQSTVFTPVETTQQSTVFTPVEPCKSQQYFVLIKSQEREYNSPKWDSNWKVLNPSPVWPPKWVIHRLTHYWLWRGNRVLIQSGYWCLLFCWCFFLRQNVCVFVCACVQLKFARIH